MSVEVKPMDARDTDSGRTSGGPKLLTAREVADILQCSPRAVATWTAVGALASVKLGRLRRYRPKDVETFVQGNVQ
jgi:excisionase family DNA binding protein